MQNPIKIKIPHTRKIAQTLRSNVGNVENPKKKMEIHDGFDSFTYTQFHFWGSHGIAMV